MKRLKTAYEIALERANSLDSEQSAEEKALFQREKLRPLLADFYRAKDRPRPTLGGIAEKRGTGTVSAGPAFTAGVYRPSDQCDELQRRKEAILAVEV